MRVLFALLLFLMPLAALAQDDRDILTRFIEDNLSGAGRTVTVTGFRGALSSRASVERLTIADDAGVWLTLTNVVLDWNRSAVLRGNIEVRELTADEVILDRLPQTGPDSLPSPEAREFALPDLPVGVAIGRIAAGRVTLGPTVLGQPVAGTLSASLSLSRGEGQGQLSIERQDDGPDGQVALNASYSNASGQLVLSLDATEGAGGIAASLLDIPGAPALRLAVEGAGPLSGFVARTRLETDGTERLAGQVTLSEPAPGTRAFAVDLGGDLAPLFLPAQADFFGPSIRLVAEGTRAASGRLDLSRLSVAARSLTLDGTLVLAADGLPERVALTGRLADPDGGPVLLPIGQDSPTEVQAADLSLSFDASQGEGWQVLAEVTGVARADVAIERLALAGSGRIARGAASPVAGSFTYSAEGLEPADPALAAALGPRISGQAEIAAEGGALQVRQVALGGDDYALTASGSVSGLATGFRLGGRADLTAEDLSRFAALARRPLSGNARVTASGSGSLLGGAFDLTLRAEGTDIGIGQAQVDRLLRGTAVVEASVARGTDGTDLRRLRIAAGGATVTAEGRIASDGSSLTGRAELPDLAVLGPGFRGSLAADVTAAGTAETGVVTIEGLARGLAIGQPGADRILSGDTVLSLRLGLRDGRLTLDEGRLTNPQVTADATGTLDADLRRIALSARLSNLALLVPQFPGPVTLTGDLTDDGQGYAVDLRAQGPGGIDATATGRVAAGFGTAVLALRGTAQAGLANPFLGSRAVSGGLGFDLGLNGPLRLSSLTGPVRLTDGRLSDPGLPFALTGIAGTATLGGGAAQVQATAGVSTRGQIAVSGRVGLARPNEGTLDVTLSGVVLRDPDLYRTTADGTLRVTGPLTGGPLVAGRVVLGETDLQVPSASSVTGGVVADLRHVNEPAEVRATRARAGLTGAAGGTTGRGGATRLDVTVSAPNRVFLRGRGLDAELGGEVTLTGSVGAIRAAGGFDLIRGRLDILGRRLTLNAATVTFEGDLVPRIAVLASTEGDGVTASVAIEGRADAPVVRFTSSPELPEEEVLAQLLFGQGIGNISAFQAAELAAAVATLAGRGGDGIVGRLRKGFGLDDLDLQTDAGGAATFTAGKYLSENLYSEVEVAPDGTSSINLNLDVRPGVTVRGSLGNGGSAGIGVFLERDY